MADEVRSYDEILEKHLPPQVFFLFSFFFFLFLFLFLFFFFGGEPVEKMSLIWLLNGGNAGLEWRTERRRRRRRRRRKKKGDMKQTNKKNE